MLRNYGFRIAALVFLGLAFWLGIRESAWGMAVAAVIAGVLALLGYPDLLSSRLDRLQSFVLSRLESVEFGNLKATLPKQINEADELITRLDKLTGVLAHPMYSMMARLGRWGTGMSQEAAADMIKQMDAALREAGYSNDQLNALKEDVHYFRMFDLAHAAITKLIPACDQLAVRAHQGERPSHLTQAQLVEKTSYLESLKLGLHQTVTAPPYSQMPDRLEVAIDRIPWLADGEKRVLRERIEPELTQMRAYLRSLTEVTTPPS